MNTKLFSLGLPDILKGIVVSVFAAVITELASIVNVPGFNFESVNWQSLLMVGFIAGLSYLSKNFISNENGKVFGVIG